MTQPPPPPPNQPPGQQPPDQPQPPQDPPPQGGFGAPTPPPPAQGPGYGYPQTPQTPPTPPPAQQPQYGYPQAAQAPQTPPPAQPGYGYPGQPQGQPPSPYAQQPPYGQPQYGYTPPTTPMHLQAPQSGGGRKLNAQMMIIVAAVAAIALIVGGGVWYSSSKGKDDDKNNSASTDGGTTGGTDDEKGTDGGTDGGGTDGGTSGGDTKAQEEVPADTSGKVLFQVPAPEVKDDSTIVVAGSWLTDKVYAKSGIAEITGYDLAKGSKQWTIPLPGPVCSASRHISEDNRTAIVHQPAMPTKQTSHHGCSEVTGIDLDTGKKLWTETVGDRKLNFDNVTVSGNTVAVGGTNGGAAFEIDSGKQLWAPKAGDSCYDSGYGGGPALVAIRKCGSYDNRTLHIQNVNPENGTVISEYKMATGIGYASIVSTQPIVVAADVGDSAKDGSGISDFFSIDGKTGELRTKITAESEKYAAKCDGIRAVENCVMLAVGNDKIYVPTEEHDGSGDYSQTNEIIAFDLATGKQTGERADAGDGYTISPLRMDGPNLLAYKRPPYDKGGQIVSIDGSTFKETKLLENPASDSVRSAETSMSPEYAELVYGGGRLFMSEIYVSKPYSADDKEYLVVAFGAQ
ncbi:outer membrane protein assembly factor BamB family protein [Streptomyces sp. NPDC002845]